MWVNGKVGIFHVWYAMFVVANPINPKPNSHGGSATAGWLTKQEDTLDY